MSDTTNTDPTNATMPTEGLAWTFPAHKPWGQPAVAAETLPVSPFKVSVVLNVVGYCLPGAADDAARMIANDVAYAVARHGGDRLEADDADDVLLVDVQSVRHGPATPAVAHLTQEALNETVAADDPADIPTALPAGDADTLFVALAAFRDEWAAMQRAREAITEGPGMMRELGDAEEARADLMERLAAALGW